MGLSLPHLIVLALVVLLLFGRGRISEMMGDFGKGIKSFKDGVADETTNRPIAPPAQLTSQPVSQPYVPPAGAQTIGAQPQPEVVPQGDASPRAGAGQPTLNGEPLPEFVDPKTPR